VNRALYALACVVFPVLWGLGVAWVSKRIGRAEHKPTIASDDIA